MGWLFPEDQGKGRGMKRISRSSSKYFIIKHSTGLNNSSHLTLSNARCWTTPSPINEAAVRTSVPLELQQRAGWREGKLPDAGLPAKQEHQSSTVEMHSQESWARAWAEMAGCGQQTPRAPASSHYFSTSCSVALVLQPHYAGKCNFSFEDYKTHVPWTSRSWKHRQIYFRCD